MKSLVQLLLLIVILHVAESLPCVRLCYFRVLSQCPLLHQKIRVWLIRAGCSVVVKLTVSSVQVFLVLNCRRNSNSNHRGFKKRKKGDSGGACPGVLLFFEVTDVSARLYPPCLLNDIVTYRRCG